MEEQVLNIFLRPGKLQVEKRSLVLGKYINDEKVKWFIKSQMPDNIDVVYFYCDEIQSIIDIIIITNIIKTIIKKDIIMNIYNQNEIPDGFDFAWNKVCDNVCYKMQTHLR